MRIDHRNHFGESTAMKSTPSILVVDDEPDLLDIISLALEHEGFDILVARSGVEALTMLESQAVDLILADIAMPDMNGYQLYERVRQNLNWGAIPFIFLTGREMDSDIRYGKELGVDDYLTKPISAADLLAVVRGKIRRSQQLVEAAAVLTAQTVREQRHTIFGPLEIDADYHKVWLNRQEIKLSAREFALVEYLAQRAGKIVSIPELLQVTHGLETDGTEAGTLIRSIIHSVRRKLGPHCIENVRGVGYRLVVSQTR
jgi:two-component system OmpR family response regulator